MRWMVLVNDDDDDDDDDYEGEHVSANARLNQTFINIIFIINIDRMNANNTQGGCY